MTAFEELELREAQLSQGTIHYRELGTGKPIVLVHGLLTNSLLWADVATVLAREFRVIAPDWPLGSHEQPLRPGTDLTPPGLAKVIADFLAALELENVTLVGNDTGGALSQLVAVDQPERLGRLVLTPCDAYENFLPPMFRPLQLGGCAGHGPDANPRRRAVLPSGRRQAAQRWPRSERRMTCAWRHGRPPAAISSRPSGGEPATRQPARSRSAVPTSASTATPSANSNRSANRRPSRTSSRKRANSRPSSSISTRPAGAAGSSRTGMVATLRRPVPHEGTGQT